MQFKKYLGVIGLFLVTLINNSGSASLFTIGLEDMPESMKKLR